MKKLQGVEDTNVALDSVVAIPYDEWSVDFQQPKPACVRRDGKCLQALFPRPPDSKKVSILNMFLLVHIIYY